MCSQCFHLFMFHEIFILSLVFDPFNSVTTTTTSVTISANSISSTSAFSNSPASTISANPINVAAVPTTMDAFNTNGHFTSSTTRTTSSPFDCFNDQQQQFKPSSEMVNKNTVSTTMNYTNNNNINNTGLSIGNDTFFANFDDAFK